MRRTTTSAATRATQLAVAGLIVLFAVMAFAAPPAAAVAGGAPGYTLKWSDEFNGPAGPIDTTQWNYRTDCKLASFQLPSNVSLDGAGHARIALAADNATCNNTSYAFSGGGLISKQAFRYGYYEARIKGPAAPYWHSAFWLMAGDGSSTYGVPYSTEIDGPEFESQIPGRVQYNIFGWSSSGIADSYYSALWPTLPTPFATSGWHVYGLEWLENSVAMYVDGALQWSAPYTQNDWIHNRLNIWLTSIAVPGAGSSLPDAMLVDYVRFYERDKYVDTQDTVALNPRPGTYAETGTWSTSTLVTPFYYPSGGPTDGAGAPPPSSWYGYSYSTNRYNNISGAAATWTPTVDATQNYRLLFWNVVYPNGDPAARINVNAGTSGSTTISQTTGSSGWADLGTFTLNAGTSGMVTLTSSGGGYARASAVKFVAADVVVDPRGPGYTEPAGTWTDSSILGYQSRAERYSNSSSAHAVYAPNLPLSGSYDVSVWVTQSANADSNEQVSVCRPDANRVCTTSTSRINGQTVTTGWQDIGQFSLQSGTIADYKNKSSGALVTLSYGGTGTTYLRVDAVKFSYLHP